MLFEEFLTTIKSIDFNRLPGEAAQLKMAPPHRRGAMMSPDQPASVRTAAVLALVIPGVQEEASIVLIERAGGSSVHAAQFSFPGGQQEQNEKLEVTALRETEEELGVLKEQIELISELTHLYIPPSNFLVYPFLGIARQRPVYRINEHEVQQVFEIPVRDLLHPAAVKEGVFGTSAGVQIRAPFYEWKNVRIWGATAMMISEIIELISTPGK